MKTIDEKDCEILNLLQVNCRMSLTDIAKKVDLSIDSVNKRIKKLQEQRIFHPKIQIRPRNFGYKNIADIKIKLNYSVKREIDEFIHFLQAHPRVAEIFSISGEYDFSIVIIAKDPNDLGKTTMDIRCKFGKIITSWTETLTTESYKFEYYDMNQLMGYPPSKISYDL
jgi:Lrp/AsnC family transcriptional regulator, leucine-responsive regulatory protein